MEQETPPLLVEKSSEIGGGDDQVDQVDQVEEVDQVDASPAQTSELLEFCLSCPPYSVWDFLGVIVALIGFFADVGSDLILAYFYFKDGLKLYFVLTLTFVVVPAFFINVHSLTSYWKRGRVTPICETTNESWMIISTIYHLLGFGQVLRYVEITHLWRFSRKERNLDRKKYYHVLMWLFAAEATVPRLIEAFMEATPQLVLQLYILATNAQTIRSDLEMGFYTGLPAQPFNRSIDLAINDPLIGSSSKSTVILQVLSVTTSLVSVAWSITSYSRGMRRIRPSKKNLDIRPAIVHFLWHLLTIGARVLSVALFASALTYWCGVACAVRWIVMSAWIIKKSTHDDYSKSMWEKLLGRVFDVVVLGAVSLFSCVNVIGHKWNYVFYYSYEVIEDALFLGMWAWVVDPVSAWFYWPALIGCLGAEVIGISLMIFYYSRLHPNGPKMDLNYLGLVFRHRAAQSRGNSLTVADSAPNGRGRATDGESPLHAPNDHLLTKSSTV